MHLKLLSVSFAGFLCAAAALADASVYEGFDYTTGQSVAGGSGGTGFTGGWSSFDGQDNGVKGGSASLPGVANLATSGLSLNVSGRTDPQIWRTLSTPISGANNTDLWISFLLRKDADGPLENSDYAVLYMGNLSVGVASNGKYALEDNNGTGTYSSISAETGPDKTMLLVAWVDFGLTTDTVRLFLAPQNGSIPVSPSVTKTFDVGTGIFEIGLLFGWESAWSFDELRMGSSLAEVTPTPEPGSLSLVVIGAAALLRRRRRA